MKETELLNILFQYESEQDCHYCLIYKDVNEQLYRPKSDVNGKKELYFHNTQ